VKYSEGISVLLFSVFGTVVLGEASMPFLSSQVFTRLMRRYLDKLRLLVFLVRTSYRSKKITTVFILS